MLPSARPGSELGRLIVAPGLGEHGRHDDGREERPRHEGTPGLLEDHRQLEEPVPLSAPALGDVEAEPALAGQLLPHRLELLVGGVEQGPGHGRGAMGVEPPTGAVTQGLVLFGDGEGHGRTFRAGRSGTIVPCAGRPVPPGEAGPGPVRQRSDGGLVRPAQQVLADLAVLVAGQVVDDLPVWGTL